jgi:hypothetical protein
MCGMKSCSDILQGMVVKMGWQAVCLIALIAIICPNMLVILHRMLSGWSSYQYQRPITSGSKTADSPYYQQLDIEECSTLHRRIPHDTVMNV